MDWLMVDDGWRNLKELKKNHLFGSQRLGLEFLIGFGRQDGYFEEKYQFCLGDSMLMCDLLCGNSRIAKDP